MASSRATVLDVRRVNRSAVLRPLLLGGPLNRVVLSELTGLSSASVTNVISDLIAEQLVVEVGTEESDGGRPRILLQVNPDFGVVIGVDVGETGIRIEGFDLSMREVAGTSVGVHPQGENAATVLDAVGSAVDRLARSMEADGRRILGVGVAVPGVVEHGREVLVHAPSLGWDDVPAARLLAGKISAPLFVENGAKTLGQAEMWLGAGRGAQHAVVMLWGTGVGAAVFADGRLFQGSASSAGEWGHTNVVSGGRLCRCGALGCLEAYVGAGALLREWAEVDPTVVLGDDPDEERWLRQLVDAAPTSPQAAALLDQTAIHVGTSIANLVNLFNPERMVIAGWAGLLLGPLLLTKVKAVVAAQALDYAADRVSIEIGQLGGDAVALGAATLVVEELLAAGGRPPA